MRLVTTALAGAVTVAFTQLATAQGAAGTTGYPSPSVNVEQQAAQNRQYGGEQNRQSNMPYSQQGDRYARNEHERHEGASGGQTRDHERHARGDGDTRDRHARGDDDDHDRRGHRGGDDDNRGRSGGN
jgi:hypothetical protein